VAISREAGARGGSIARRLGRQLGWQVFDQEMLGFLARDPAARDELLADIPPEAVAWAGVQVGRLTQARSLAAGSDLAELVRLVFVLAARGEAVIVGRGAGALLPVESTLNVRVVAPLAERVAYMGQWLRLPGEAAAAEVASRDRIRAELHRGLTERESGDPTQYDLVLNSGRLGEAGCTTLIVQALEAKRAAPPPADPDAVDPV
jgi:hypothetical protein